MPGPGMEFIGDEEIEEVTINDELDVLVFVVVRRVVGQELSELVVVEEALEWVYLAGPLTIGYVEVADD